MQTIAVCTPVGAIRCPENGRRKRDPPPSLTGVGTFMRNHAMTTVQSRNGHSWARDVLSPLRSRSRAFRYHLSANCRSVILGRLAYGSSITCCVMLRSVPTWSRMCCGTPRSLGRRSAAFSNTRFADSSVSPKMFDRVYGHHHPDHLAGAANALTGTGNGGRIAGGNAATNVNKRERTRQKTLKIQENPGSEPRSGRGGRRFKSCHSDQHLAEFSSRFATGCAPG